VDADVVQAVAQPGTQPAPHAFVELAPASAGASDRGLHVRVRAAVREDARPLARQGGKRAVPHAGCETLDRTAPVLCVVPAVGATLVLTLVLVKGSRHHPTFPNWVRMIRRRGRSQAGA
jgi:hypothetical protein